MQGAAVDMKYENIIEDIAEIVVKTQNSAQRFRIYPIYSDTDVLEVLKYLHLND